MSVELAVQPDSTSVMPPEKPPEKTQTIKLRFRARTTSIKSWISNSVDIVSRIAIHVSRFANMYVLHSCENNLALPEIDNIFYNNVMYLVTNTQKDEFADQQLQTAFKTLYADHIKTCVPLRTTDQYRFLERLTLDMETNTRVYLKTQFITRFRQWCKDFIVSIVPLAENSENLVEKKQQRWKIVSFLFQQTAKSDSVITDTAQLFEETNLALQESCGLIWSNDIAMQVCSAIAKTRQQLNSSSGGQKSVFCRPITGTKLLRTDLSACYLKWMFTYLQSLERHNANPNAQQKKVFSMLPIRCLDRSYISISETCLREWIYRNRKQSDAVGREIHDKIKHMKTGEEFKIEFENNKLWYWQQCFDFENAIKPNSRFSGPILTDGYAYSITTQKATRQKEMQNTRDSVVITLSDDERETDRKIKVFSSEELSESDVIGVDPGRKTLYTSVFERQNDKHAIATYSAGRWRHASGGNEAKRKREQWMKARSEEYNTWLLSMPTTKVASVSGMQVHMQHLMQRLNECLEENGKTRVRKLKFSNYITNQKALASMVKEFISQTKRAGSSKKKLIVAFGDASFKTSGPVKKMKVELKRRNNIIVVDMDEFHSSLMMTCCAFADDREQRKAVEREGPLVKSKDKEGNECCTRLYGVSCCKNCTCYWNRDVNAAVNILRIFQHAQENNGARHEFFSRRVATSSKQKRTAAKRKMNDDEKTVQKKSKTVEAKKPYTLQTGRT